MSIMRKAHSKMRKDGESMNPSKDDLQLNISRNFEFLLSLFWKNRPLFKVQIVGLREEGTF